ncbi:TetR family transcriptional regulator [Roseibium algicola]|jgi:TetR/AcrR family transcriptional regulator of autoinduction and epiphytic fitness|uniref:TetR family transcriptional regulator n=1 Tax=Roseibium algicola TaxID=2857014 RepID=A0ABM6I2J1_9HYPH|nr:MULTISPECIES: TetR/AcrR family transcriptional regulator [Stappiaceae]AMN51527.1 TetR family transcriptional regulator [Labrenzia sp. CP4]AQQ04580.1 TetR family transcriptional regulator [Roseibium aggregatum]UES55176.1 TetR family transcriptional regulator [Roseibium aggregatum]
MSVSDQKKKQIVEAAIAEFQEKGYAGASMDRISERAQVSKRTVYNHFESKDVLFKEINQCLADQINSALEVAYDPAAPIRDALVRLGWAEGELMINPCFMSLARMVMSETIRDPALAADMDSRMTKISVFTEFMDRATREGKLTADDPSLAATQFLGLIKARSFYPNIHSGRVTTRPEMERIIEESVDMFLARYGAKATAQTVAAQ